MLYKFYDTNALLTAGEALFEENAPRFIISSISIKELENIKQSMNKDIHTKATARKLLRLLDEYPEKYNFYLHTLKDEHILTHFGFEINNDTKILSDVYACGKEQDIIFVTNDLGLKAIAKIVLSPEKVESYQETDNSDNYTGYKEGVVDEISMANFYQNPTTNHFNLLTGEYLILRNELQEVVDLCAWDGQEHRHLNIKPINSTLFGKIVPYQGDTYQKLLFDSLRSNKITLVRGPAGSGKSIVSLAYLVSRVENHTLDKIIIFCNTVATANSAKLGLDG